MSKNPKMTEAYINLKRKLEDLGYNNTLPLEALPLVECILADLLQTTRSLQHYMDLAKEALMQRDSLMLEAEPYRCENIKLIKEINELHSDNLKIKEESDKLIKEYKRKIKILSADIIKKDSSISKLQHEVRDLGLRGLCASTQSSRFKSKHKNDNFTVENGICVCTNKNYTNVDNKISELTSLIKALEEKNETYNDEILLLQNQVENRDTEIIRLNMLLEGGRPMTAISKDCYNFKSDTKIVSLSNQLQQLQNENLALKNEIDVFSEKQHEAMSRALRLADENKALKDELQKVDSLALKVEDDCNKRLSSMSHEITILQTRLEGISLKNSGLLNEKPLETPVVSRVQELLKMALNEKEVMHTEIRDLIELNKSLQSQILSLSTLSTSPVIQKDSYDVSNTKCLTKDDLKILLENERHKNELYMRDIQIKLNDTISLFNNHMQKCKEKTSKQQTLQEDSFNRDLHNRLCESEQRLLLLKKENDEMKKSSNYQAESNRQNFKDIISHLNTENAELSKENMSLSYQLSKFKNLSELKFGNNDQLKKEIQNLQVDIDKLKYDNQILMKDKEEYKIRSKESNDMVDNLKRSLAQKQKEVEQLQEENCSYKMTNRTGKASVDHLIDECNFLREQMKHMQSEVIKEKTFANQIKNIQLETERSSSEVHNEILCVQKKLSISKDTIESLESKCKDLQYQISTFKNEKSTLIESLKKIDQERDKLVIELDNKTEAISVLEQKNSSQKYDISKLENELSEIKCKLNLNKMTEHKILDSEAQIKFLNGEILRLNQQYENAVIENKHLQNNLADAQGMLKINKIEYDKSRKEVEGLRQQLQHYVAEIRRIEELLSHKEAERSDMLEHFASLSVEANILENTNHSLESESASKSQQLHSYVSRIQELESCLADKEKNIDNQSARIASMTCKISSLENEVKIINEEKSIMEQKISYLKQMCKNLQEHADVTRGIGDADTELKLFENRIKTLSNAKSKLEIEKEELRENHQTTEKLLSNCRREVIDLKIALQDATSETKTLREKIRKFSKKETEIHEQTTSREEYDLPLMLEETIHEVSQEEDEDSSRYREIHKRLSRYSHSGTL